MIAKLKMYTTGNILVKFVSKIYYRYIFFKYVVCVQERARGVRHEGKSILYIYIISKIWIYIYIYIYIYILKLVTFMYISWVAIFLRFLNTKISK